MILNIKLNIKLKRDNIKLIWILYFILNIKWYILYKGYIIILYYFFIYI